MGVSETRAKLWEAIESHASGGGLGQDGLDEINDALSAYTLDVMGERPRQEPTAVPSSELLALVIEMVRAYESAKHGLVERMDISWNDWVARARAAVARIEGSNG